MKSTYIFVIIFLTGLQACGQKKEGFDIVSYTAPKGWSKTQKPETITFSKEIGNDFCMITIYKNIDASDNAETNFDMAWQNLVQENLGVASTAAMQPGSTDNGWETKIGSASFDKEGIKGAVILISSTQNSKLVNILSLTNSNTFQKEMETFLESIDLKTAMVAKNTKSPQTVANEKDGIPISLVSNYKNGSGALSDYKFIVPPSYVGTVYSNEIQFMLDKSYGKYIVSMLPLKSYSGNIETDFSTIFQNEFVNWQVYTSGSVYSTDEEYQKGITCQGFPYMMGRKLLMQDNKNPSGPKIEGLLLLIKVGNKLATIVASQPFKNERREADLALNYLLFTLRFNNVVLPPNNLVQQLEGSWFSASSSGGVGTTYYKNGTFNSGGVLQTRVSHDAYYDKVITTNYASEGAFKLIGNELTKSFKANGIKKIALIRFYYTRYNYNADGWKYKMQILDPNSKCAEPCVPTGAEYQKEN